MSQKQKDYQQALDSLPDLTEEIQSAFFNHANEGEALALENLPSLLDDLTAIFRLNFAKAAKFISKDNEQVTKYFELDSISLQDFIELIKMWLQKKASKKSKQTQGIDPEQEETQEAQQDEEGEKNSERNNESRANESSIHENNGKNLPRNYKKNKERLDELLLKHREDFQEKFDQAQDQETGTLPFQDYFNFLQDCFALDSFILFEKQENEYDFFGSENGPTILGQVVEQYFEKVKGVDPSEFTYDDTHLTFNECFDIIDFYFQTNEDVVLLEEKKFEEQQPSSQQNLNDVRGLLLETIAKYEKMFQEAKSEMEKEILQGTIDTLHAKLAQLDKGEQASQEDESARERNAHRDNKRREKAERGLKDIFEFYSKQQLNGGKASTFDRIGRQFNSINLGKFSVILKNYQIKIDQMRLKEVFKKIATDSEALTFEEFMSIFQKIAREVELIKEQKVVKPNYEIMKEYKPDSYKKTPVPKATQKKELKKPERNEAVKLDEIWEHMGLFDGTYRNNLSTVQLAFNSHEKDTFRIKPDSLHYKFKVQAAEGKSAQEIKEEIFQRNEFRKVVKDVKAYEKSLLKSYKDVPLKITPRREKSVPERFEKRGEENNYASLQANKTKPALPSQKVTLKEVLKSNYSDIKATRFNPRDLIEENDDEDNFYLAEYNLLAEKKEELPQSALLLKNNDDLNSAIHKKSRVPGKYSYVANQRSGSGLSKVNKESNYEKKPITLSDVDYGKINRSTPLLGNSKSGLGISQSVKHQGTAVNLKNFHHEPSKIRNYDPHPYQNKSVFNNGIQPQEVFAYLDRHRANAVLDRAAQVQHNSNKREQEIINNLMNLQNTKIEQGLKVARR